MKSFLKYKKGEKAESIDSLDYNNAEKISEEKTTNKTKCEYWNESFFTKNANRHCKSLKHKKNYRPAIRNNSINFI